MTAPSSSSSSASSTSASTSTYAPIAALGDYLDGRFVLPAQPDGAIDTPSPADFSDRVGCFPTATAHVSAAVEAARRAAPGWAATPLATRMEALRRLKAALAQREEAIVAAMSREVGKPTWEARTEARALAAKVDITLAEGMELVRGFSLEGGRLEARYRPLGVLAVIGPFNFPLHLAHGHIVPALATGNTVVFKPSEVAPATAQLYAQAVDAAGLPPGVFNLVQGGGAAGAALSGHADVDGVLFTGSYATGVRIIQANAHRPGHMLALELGGKNAAVVLADAPFEKSLYDVLYSAFITAGQRCTALSRVVVERAIADRFIEALVQRAPGFRVGHHARPDVFCGPLATRAGFDKYRALQQAAVEEGHERLLASTTPDDLPEGCYVTPAIHKVRGAARTGRYLREELFGPDLAIEVADDWEHACRLADDSDYGLAAAVFTGSEERFEAVAARLQSGCITWNAPTVGSSSKLPFGGVRNSGNHRPAALFSTLYCTYPVAVTKGSAEPPTTVATGVRWGG